MSPLVERVEVVPGFPALHRNVQRPPPGGVARLRVEILAQEHLDLDRRVGPEVGEGLRQRTSPVADVVVHFAQLGVGDDRGVAPVHGHRPAQGQSVSGRQPVAVGVSLEVDAPDGSVVVPAHVDRVADAVQVQVGGAGDLLDAVGGDHNPVKDRGVVRPGRRGDAHVEGAVTADRGQRHGRAGVAVAPLVDRVEVVELEIALDRHVQRPVRRAVPSLAEEKLHLNLLAGWEVGEGEVQRLSPSIADGVVRIVQIGVGHLVDVLRISPRHGGRAGAYLVPDRRRVAVIVAFHPAAAYEVIGRAALADGVVDRAGQVEIARAADGLEHARRRSIDSHKTADHQKQSSFSHDRLLRASSVTEPGRTGPAESTGTPFLS